MFDHPMPRLTKVQGFSLIELIIVIIIISIIGVNVFSPSPQSRLSLEYEVRRVLNDIRYAQLLSMTTGQRYRWVKASANTYQILNEAGVAVPTPAGASQITFGNGISFGTLTNLPNNLIAFDSQGIPYTTSILPGTALAASATIVINGVNVSRTITVLATTGYGDLS